MYYKKIISIGGGAAEFSRILRDRGADVVFTDGNLKNVKRAKELGFEAHLVDLNIGLSEIESGRYDGAEMLDVIEHIPNANRLLNEVNRILKKDGFLLISTPNVALLGLRIKALRGKPPFQEGYHFRFFTKENLISLLREKGFCVVARNCKFNRVFRFIILPISRLIKLQSTTKYFRRFESLLANDFIYRVEKIKDISTADIPHGE